ncbi:hypothetical protein IWQ61_003010 [Dispira simplex]|nr:hypothetical protein IWQ61_003010 [Dispira simplex]
MATSRYFTSSVLSIWARSTVPLRYYASRATGKLVGPDPNSTILTEAVKILRAYEVGRPHSPIEMHIQCFHERHLSPIRGSCFLPRSVHDEAKVLVFAEGQLATEAKKAGAAVVGGAEMLPLIVEGKIEFDKCLSTVDMLPTVAKIARFLGPKGLMPTKNKGTVTNDIANAVKFSRATFDYRMDKNGIVRCVIARTGFSFDEIKENIHIVMSDIRTHAPKTRKAFIGTTYLSTPRGPGIWVNDI